MLLERCTRPGEKICDSAFGSDNLTRTSLVSTPKKSLGPPLQEQKGVSHPAVSLNGKFIFPGAIPYTHTHTHTHTHTLIFYVKFIIYIFSDIMKPKKKIIEFIIK
jgi:hypothetical protein